MPGSTSAADAKTNPDTDHPDEPQGMVIIKMIDAMAGTAAIEALLDDPLPDDWADPAAVEVRQDYLAAVASAAGEGMLNLLVYWEEARSRGDVRLTADAAPVMAASETLLTLHRALFRYGHDVPQLNDGTEIALSAIEDNVGAGIAAIVMGSLERLRASLQQLMLEQARSSLAD
jgi:hypothetical protein